MKIERVFYGMLTGTGKITLEMTKGVRQLVTQKDIEYIKALKPEDSHRYIWFPSAQVVAYPVVAEVQDERKGKGGRTWVQNQTQLMSIHDYIGATLDGVFTPHVLPVLSEFPESFEAITV